MLDELRLYGLTGHDQELPTGVQVKHGVNASGKQLHYYLNYTSSAQRFTYPYAAARDLLTKREIGSGSQISVGPRDLIIAEEN